MILMSIIITFDNTDNERNIEISNESEDKKRNSAYGVISIEESERIAAEARREFERSKPGEIIYITKEGKVLNGKEHREFYKKYRIEQKK